MDKQGMKAQLKEYILDACRKTVDSTSALDVHCLLVVSLNEQEMILLNIEETISPSGNSGNDKDDGPHYMKTEAKISSETQLKHGMDDTGITDDDTDTQTNVQLFSILTDDKVIKTTKTKRKKVFHHRANYQCSVCSIIIHRKDNLNRHMKKHTGQMIKCHHCPREFYSKAAAQEHVEVDHKNNPYLCYYCGKEFKYKQHLKEHISAHEGQYKYECADCDKKYTNKESYKYHRSVHEGTRNFSCSKCARTFITKGHLQGHEEKCTGVKEKSIFCSKCCKNILRTNYEHHLKQCNLSRGPSSADNFRMDEKERSQTSGGQQDVEIEYLYQDIPTSTEIKLKSGETATIALRQHVHTSNMPVKVDSLASSKIGQSLKESAMTSATRDPEPHFLETNNGQIVMESGDDLNDIEIPASEAQTPMFNQVLRADGHDYTSVSVLSSASSNI